MDVVMIQHPGFLNPQQQLVANLAQKVHRDYAIPLCWQRSMVGTGKHPPWLLFTSRPTEFSRNWLGLSEKDGAPVTKHSSTEGSPWHAWVHIFFLNLCLTTTTTKKSRHISQILCHPVSIPTHHLAVPYPLPPPSELLHQCNIWALTRTLRFCPLYGHHFWDQPFQALTEKKTLTQKDQ